MSCDQRCAYRCANFAEKMNTYTTCVHGGCNIVVGEHSWHNEEDGAEEEDNRLHS